MAKKTEKTKKAGSKKTAAKASPKKTTAKDSPKRARTKVPPKTKRAQNIPRSTTKKRTTRDYDPARDYEAASKLLTQARTNADSDGAHVSGTDPCACGHSPEEHGHDADHPGSTGCVVCADGDCVAYESDPESSD